MDSEDNIWGSLEKAQTSNDKIVDEKMKQLQNEVRHEK